VAELTRDAKVVLWVMWRLDHLRERGLVAGGPGLTEEGRADLGRMREEGFAPAADEVHGVLAYLFPDPEAADAVRKLLSAAGA
jgi:hypothetical protein